MRKHATEHGSSFDMLLDTMCNTFGGIVFIALLLAILSGSVRRNDGRRGTVDDVSAGAGSTEIEVASLKRDVEKLLTAVDTLHQALSTSSEDEHTASHLLSELNVANRAIREKVAAITVTNANLLREEASVSGENETMVASVEALKAALIAIRSEHERQRTSSRREVRLPRVHAVTGKRAVFMGLRRGKFYAISDVSRVFSRDTARGYDLADVDIEVGPAKEVIELREKSGQSVVPGCELSGKLAKALSSIVVSDEVAVFAVARDSFAEFNYVKSKFVEAGVSYNWSVHDGAIEIVLADNIEAQ